MRKIQILIGLGIIIVLIWFIGGCVVAPPYDDRGYYYDSPPVVINEPPLFLYSPSIGFYTAVGIPYDLFYVDHYYYLLHRSNWYRAKRYNGPWGSMGYNSLPHSLRNHRYEDIVREREREYRSYHNERNRYRSRYFRPDRYESGRPESPNRVRNVPERPESQNRERYKSRGHKSPDIDRYESGRPESPNRVRNVPERPESQNRERYESGGHKSPDIDRYESGRPESPNRVRNVPERPESLNRERDASGGQKPQIEGEKGVNPQTEIDTTRKSTNPKIDEGEGTKGIEKDIKNEDKPWRDKTNP